MKITLKDGSVKEYESGISVIDIAKERGPGQGGLRRRDKRAGGGSAHACGGGL